MTSLKHFLWLKEPLQAACVVIFPLWNSLNYQHRPSRVTLRRVFISIRTRTSQSEDDEGSEIVAGRTVSDSGLCWGKKHHKSERLEKQSKKTGIKGFDDNCLLRYNCPTNKNKTKNKTSEFQRVSVTVHYSERIIRCWFCFKILRLFPLFCSDQELQTCMKDFVTTISNHSIFWGPASIQQSSGVEWRRLQSVIIYSMTAWC